MADVARAVGLSRQRVHQILREEGYNVRRRPRDRAKRTSRAVLRALRSPAATSLDSTARLAHCSVSTVWVVLRRAGVSDTARRLFRARRIRQWRRGILAAIRDFPRRNGRLPKQRDVIQGRLPVSLRRLVLCFGSWRGALAAAGLRPKVGFRPATKPWIEQILKNPLKKEIQPE